MYEADSVCDVDNAKIAEPMSLEENAYILSLGNTQVWIGARIPDFDYSPSAAR